MNWLEKNNFKISKDSKKKDLPENLWTKCPCCGHVMYSKDLKNNMMVCTNCGHHMRLNARQRVDLTFDKNDRKEHFVNIRPNDPLSFEDTKPYKERLKQAQKKTNEKDALVVFEGKIKDCSLIAAIFNFSFLGGSMGSVVGEKFVCGVDLAIRKNLPFICFTASGGARMQESLFSLMQMSKTSAALAKLSEKKLPYIVILTDPTTGGVSASLAMLGDIQIAEPNALIGFAGPRVIEQTVQEKLPKNFQRSEFLLEKGMIDKIVHRKELRQEISKILKKL